MSNHFRFTPSSIEAFKRTARDIQRAYPLGLQQAQEILAKVYGYPHLHALQQHLQTKPPGGPYPSTLEAHAGFSMRQQALSRFLQLAGVPQSGRMGIEDLWIVEEPEVRKEAMDFQLLIDSYVDGSAQAEPTVPTSEYVVFDDRRPESIGQQSRFSGVTRREGVFQLTRRGKAMHDAMLWLNELLERTEPGTKERHRAMRASTLLIERYPNNPYPIARALIRSASHLIDDDDDDDSERDRDLAIELWLMFKDCRRMFDSIIPKGFRGDIEPKLVGHNIENFEYLALLYWGAQCAAVAEQFRDALAWARRCLRLHSRDSFGARFLIEDLSR